LYNGLIGVIADDLTGAMDAGMQLLAKNVQIRTALTVDDLDAVVAGADVVVANTQSRNIDPRIAHGQVKAALGKLLAGGCRAWYKKIDSTLRGNIGAELRAALESGIFALVIVAPALPFNKRTTVNGVHYVDGVRLAEIELAKDPFAPIACSEVGEIIRNQFEVPVGHLDLSAVRQGGAVLRKKAEEYLAAGIRVLAADAEEEQDLQNIAAAAGLLSGKTLLCGSAGLFQHFDRAYPIPGRSGEPRADIALEELPVLVLSGSPAQMSKRQIRYAEVRRDGTVVIRCDVTAAPEAELTGSMQRVAEIVVNHLRAGKNVVLDAAGESKESILLQSWGDRGRLDHYSALVQKLVRDTASAAAQAGISALVLFGGDTAVSALKGLGGQGIEIIGEVEPYIPLGRLIGGAYSGLPVVTKAGGFGGEKSLIRILAELSSLKAGAQQRRQRHDE
jgi:uncharacterized protein YgbK (DUF1537 family)